jgi:hypothetical protein
MIYYNNAVFQNSVEMLLRPEHLWGIHIPTLKKELIKIEEEAEEKGFTAHFNPAPLFYNRELDKKTGLYIYDGYYLARNSQNLLIAETNFPAVYFTDNNGNKNDILIEEYSDRLSDEERQIAEKLIKNGFTSEMPAEKLLPLVKAVFKNDKITGAQYVRDTHLQSMNPVFYISAIVKSKETPQYNDNWYTLLEKVKDKSPYTKK